MRKVAVCGRRMRPAAPPTPPRFPAWVSRWGGEVDRGRGGGGRGAEWKPEAEAPRASKPLFPSVRRIVRCFPLPACPASLRAAPTAAAPPRRRQREGEGEGGRASSGERAAASRGRGSCPPRRRPRSVEVLPAPRRLARPRPCSAAAMSDKEFMWALKNGDLDEVKDYVAKVGGGGEGLGWARRRWGEGGDVQRAPSVRGSAGWGRAWGRTVGFPRR